MVEYLCYRRADETAGTYFFTVNLVERKRTLLVDHVDLFRAGFARPRQPDYSTPKRDECERLIEMEQSRHRKGTGENLWQ